MGIVYQPEPRGRETKPPNASPPWKSAHDLPIGTIWRTWWQRQYWVVESMGYAEMHMWVWIPASAVPEPYERGVPDFPEAIIPE